MKVCGRVLAVALSFHANGRQRFAVVHLGEEPAPVAVIRRRQQDHRGDVQRLRLHPLSPSRSSPEPRRAPRSTGRGT